MPGFMENLSKLIKKSISDSISASTNACLTSENIKETKISGYRSMHAHQVYKRKRLVDSYKRIGAISPNNQVGP